MLQASQATRMVPVAGDEQVIVRQGVLTRAVKHVPYRTVTNITVKRGVIDRWLGLGTLDIQTAGMSGNTGAEVTGLRWCRDAWEVDTAGKGTFRGRFVDGSNAS